MKQVLHSFSTGNTTLEDLPTPTISPGHLLIKTHCSLLSSGTERMLVDFGKSNLIDKARLQPDKVQDVLNKVRTDGLVSTISAVNSKLDQPIPLGYCNAGVVLAVGSGVTGFSVGDRVVSNGPHAEVVSVPFRLCSRVPDSVPLESAVFTVISSIGLQGIRLANPTFGETFLVSGLGLVGLLTSQLLASNGCRVLGIDPDPSKCNIAERLGISTLCLSSDTDPLQWCLNQTGSVGVDAVIITASTSSSEPLHLAAQACRQRGRIVLVGVSGLNLRRDLFFKKELSFQVSCSYGPGRYDPHYEDQGNDYPIGFVRWTEQRNFDAVLESMKTGHLRVDELVSHRFAFDDAPSAYELLLSSNPSLGILLNYRLQDRAYTNTTRLSPTPVTRPSPSPRISLIGCGNYSNRVLIPAFRKAGAIFSTASSSSGLGPWYAAKTYGFPSATTDTGSIMVEDTSDAVVVATRHNSHASLVVQALDAGKHVFVEKPLCLTSVELSDIETAFTGAHHLMVGYNRRFAPLIGHLSGHLSRLAGPKSFVYICNSGFIPANHWTQDPEIGGGRLIGEACHFVDLLRFLAASPIQHLQVFSGASSHPCPDTFSIQIAFADGSIGTVHYFANGSKSYPKERLEVFSAGKVFRLDNFRKLQAWGLSGFRTRRLFSQDKGQRACCAAFLKAIETGGPSPIPLSEIFEVQRWLLDAVNK